MERLVQVGLRRDLDGVLRRYRAVILLHELLRGYLSTFEGGEAVVTRRRLVRFAASRGVPARELPANSAFRRLVHRFSRVVDERGREWRLVREEPRGCKRRYVYAVR